MASRFETRLMGSDRHSYKELFKRFPGNPILSAKNWPYAANTVFNPAATMYNGKVLLLIRVEDRRGFSHLTKAISDDGISNWIIDDKPTLEAEPEKFPEEEWGVEDRELHGLKNWGNLLLYILPIPKEDRWYLWRLRRILKTLRNLEPLCLRGQGCGIVPQED